MRTLVIGGAGFIGSHLVDRLLEDGHEVVVLDNFVTGRHENLAHHKDKVRLKVHQVDITELKSIQPYFEGVEWVFHLAGLADIVPSIVHPLNYYRTNVDGTVNVIECSRQANVKRFIYVASSTCYGIPDKYPTPESADIRLHYPYALTKYIGEKCVIHWGEVYKIPVISLRLFNVYGIRSRTSGAYGAVFGVFFAQKIAHQPFTIVGDGTQTRDFTYITDVISALITAAKSDVKTEIFNVGSGGTYSINRLVELLGGEVVHIPKRPGEPDCTLADIKKIKQLLGWEPKVSFKRGVEIMLQNIDYWEEAPLWSPATILEATEDWFKYLT